MSTDAQIEAAAKDPFSRAKLYGLSDDEALRAALAAAQAGAGWQQTEEWIVMADNRLEVADCPGCIDVARSYLQEALAAIRALRPLAAPAESEE